MNVAVLCEFSGTVRDAFIRRGHNAVSYDLLPSEAPGPHVQGDVREKDLTWADLVIAFPPCTHLASSGAKHFAAKRADGRQAEGIEFFMWMVNLPCQHMAIENPVGIMSKHYRKPDQIIQPWQFGDEYQKTTCLWLKNLPKLVPTSIVGRGEFVTTKSGKRLPKWYSSANAHTRSKTFPGIASAMAEQWGGIVRAEKGEGDGN